MRLILLSFFLFTSNLIFAQKNIERRKIEAISSVEIKGSINFSYVPSNEFLIEIKGDYPEDILTEIQGSELVIFHKKGKSWLTNEINTIGRGYSVVLHAPTLGQIVSTGSGNISIDGILKSDQLKIKLDGSGNITGKLNVADFDIDNTGSSNIRLSGNVVKANIKSSGSGNFQSFDLIIDDCSISKSGSGNAHITVNHTLTASISGSGNLTYKGSPKILASSSAGLGKIKKY